MSISTQKNSLDIGNWQEKVNGMAEKLENGSSIKRILKSINDNKLNETEHEYFQSIAVKLHELTCMELDSHEMEGIIDQLIINFF